MANVPNVQIKIDNTSSSTVSVWTVHSSYSDHFDINSFEYNVAPNTDESMITFNSGVGNNHDMKTSSTVTVGTTTYSSGSKTFKAKEGMVITYTFNGSTLEFAD